LREAVGANFGFPGFKNEEADIPKTYLEAAEKIVGGD